MKIGIILDINTTPVKNSIYDHVKYDSSTIEKPFAKDLDNDTGVKIFFKIPSSFKIETPIGSYNPDWAIYLKDNKEEKLYFIYHKTYSEIKKNIAYFIKKCYYNLR